ncbi:MAG: EAL domain-containing protein [gamma proteobacterium symbiont of Lucinoma myriamae]|nr:EAL domain-containing protein [gamma proteobacterium symbiont of Lucinoma myriamae]
MSIKRHFSLRIKLILYTLFFIVTSMMTIGLVSDNYLHNYFHKTAKEQLKEAFYDLSIQLKIIEKNLLEGIHIISENEAIIASLNLIKNYEDINNYNSILFDEEKKRILNILLLKGAYSRNNHIAVYDSQYRLVAFIDREEGDRYIQGYTSYKEGKAAYYSKSIDSESYHIIAPPKHIPQKIAASVRLGAFMLQSGQVIYKNKKNQLSLQANRSILRNISDYQSDIIGYIETDIRVSREKINKLVDKKDLFIDYYFDKGEVHTNNKDKLHIENIEVYDNAPLLFSKFNAEELYLGDNKFHFISGAHLPLYERSLLVLAQIDKEKLQTTLVKNRMMLVFVLLFIIIATIVVSIFVLNKMISIPLGRLLEGINIISDGDYSHKIVVAGQDELGMISKQFNLMARRVEKREHELDDLAHHDVLTKMPNRIMFHERLNEAVSRAKRLKSNLAVLFLDLDDFKLINDTLGHNVGDKLLIEVAKNLAQCLRTNDLLARIGGDEFNIMIEDVDSVVFVEGIAKKIITQMKLPHFIDSDQINITASIGIAVYPTDGEDSITLLKNADLAMYQAKKIGPEQYCFFSEQLSLKLKERTVLLKALKRALQDGQFVLYYQPKFSTSSSACLVHGAEALIRWQSPELGLVSPDRFIPLCEESGLIVSIGQWVLEQAVADMKKWQELGLPVEQISVNVSNVQFSQGDIYNVIKQVLEETGLSANHLEIEMTESYIHHHSDNAMEVLQQIRSLGVELAIDDFGTGYSSMSYLKHLPLTRLKIDKSFIDGIPDDTDDLEIAKAIIALAKVLQLKTTAEGIETIAQLESLKELGCEEGQGYLCSRPLDYEAFVKFVHRHMNCELND